MLDLLPILASAITALLGLMGVLCPKCAASFVGLSLHDALAEAEVRATYGGFFLGLGMAALLLKSPLIYTCLGTAWLCAAFARCMSLKDKQARIAKNVAGVAFEAVIGLLFLSVYFLSN